MGHRRVDAADEPSRQLHADALAAIDASVALVEVSALCCGAVKAALSHVAGWIRFCAPDGCSQTALLNEVMAMLSDCNHSNTYEGPDLVRL